MFNTRNKSGISAHPCIILYLPNVSMLTYFSMSGADKGYIAMFSRTNLFLAILRLNNKVIFNPTKALGKLGNIVAETFVILDVSSNQKLFPSKFRNI